MTEIDLEWNHFNIPKLLGVSAVGYCIENLFAYPLFLIKTREQISTSPKTLNVNAGQNIFRTIIRENGVRGLYKGYWTASIGGLPSLQAYILTYHFTKHKLATAQGPWSSEQHRTSKGFSAMNFVAPMFAGFAAEAVSLSLYVPVDVITQQLQLPENRQKSGSTLFREIARQQGLKGLFKGFGITALTLGTSSSVWWLVYEQCKAKFADIKIPKLSSVSMSQVQATGANIEASLAQPPATNQTRKIGQGPKVGSILAGIIGGSCAVIVTQPFDVVKTRIQTMKPKSEQQSPPVRMGSIGKGSSSGLLKSQERTGYSGIAQGFRTIYVTEGLRGFLRGLPVKLVVRVPIHATLAFCYEFMLYLSVR